MYMKRIRFYLQFYLQKNLKRSHGNSLLSLRSHANTQRKCLLRSVEHERNKAVRTTSSLRFDSVRRYTELHDVGHLPLSYGGKGKLRMFLLCLSVVNGKGYSLRNGLLLTSVIFYSVKLFRIKRKTRKFDRQYYAAQKCKWQHTTHNVTM